MDTAKLFTDFANHTRRTFQPEPREIVISPLALVQLASEPSSVDEAWAESRRQLVEEFQLIGETFCLCEGEVNTSGVLEHTFDCPVDRMDRAVARGMR